MPIHPRGAALPQDIHDLLGALGGGSDQDELTIVIERSGISLDHLIRQVTMGKMGFKGPDNGVPVRLRWQSGFGTAPNHRRSRARRKHRRTDIDCLSSHDGLIVNSVFKSRASQSFDGFVQVRALSNMPTVVVINIAIVTYSVSFSALAAGNPREASPDPATAVPAKIPPMARVIRDFIFDGFFF